MHQDRTYAGVLPATIDDQGVRHFLLGRERVSDAFGDFGGGVESGETIVAAAARECHEESMGMLGTQDEIRAQIIHHTVKTADMVGFRGSVFMVHIPFDTNINVYFNRVVKYLGRCQIQCPDGYLEKSEMRWFSEHELMDMYRRGPSSADLKFRPNILHNIVKQFIQGTSIHEVALGSDRG